MSFLCSFKNWRQDYGQSSVAFYWGPLSLYSFLFAPALPRSLNWNSSGALFTQIKMDFIISSSSHFIFLSTSTNKRTGSLSREFHVKNSNYEMVRSSECKENGVQWEEKPWNFIFSGKEIAIKLGGQKVRKGKMNWSHLHFSGETVWHRTRREMAQKRLMITFERRKGSC